MHDLPVPPGALSDVQRRALDEAIRDARAHHAALLERSIANALDHVPRVLRGALKKVLF